MTSTILDSIRPIESADVAGKRVLVRADLNVPVADGRVTDATRIERFLPTVKMLAERGAKVVVLSHFGRPKGTVKPEFSLKPVADAMAEHLPGIDVRFVSSSIGSEAAAAVDQMAPGSVVLLENLRFHPGEEKNDPELAKELAALGDIYANDAFSCAHRAHASTEALAHLLPAYVGPMMMAEIRALTDALEAPERPVAAVVGGAKVSTKIPVLSNLTSKVDRLIIGGGMANTFLQAQGFPIGKSLAETDQADVVQDIVSTAAKQGCEVVLPVDAVVAGALEPGVATDTVTLRGVPNDQMILDIGPESIAMVEAIFASCRTVLWNGPVGAFEVPPFDQATASLAQTVAKLTQSSNMTSVAGGGDTVAALNHAGVTDQFTYVSAAGGAFLEWLEGRQLPGVVALQQA